MREGQVFYADYAKPEGFCDEAWKAVYQYVFALSHGAGKFYFGDWITKEGVAICSCNDGLRPVIMKIERTDQDSSIDYEPGGVISEVRAERGTNISKRRCGLNTRSAVSHPVSGSAYSSSVFSSIRRSAAPTFRPVHPGYLRGSAVFRGRSSHPADSPPIRRDNTTLTRKMRRVFPEVT